MERASTDGLRPAGKAQAWSARYSEVLAAADFIPFDDDFSSNAVFTRSFRERYDLSPTEYRVKGAARACGERRPVAISFDRSVNDATLDRASAGRA